ncbi:MULTISPECIES: DegQ family serine endoprotease [unclassified Hahella]|uniref:DegQ family serine endoprotease n=1 Tax=unclassified Hahella TaxID=2624107 RepID=UPI001C1F1848|nr:MULTISPECIES: DegQ family serine endoprotease [unclassified Hahella]MBU6953124.1 DegQ family serine endoprotease [Hahella sp. HN01]MDG9669886.1 DegQ family serine endoprotease [Hahella sp. CR1]
MLMGKTLSGLRLCVLAVSVGWAASSAAALPLADSQGQPLPTLAPMLKEVNPAVVNIATYAKQESYSPLMQDPFFRHFFNIPDNRRPREQRRQQSAGSGVIVDKDNGTVVTNYHVIKGADEVHVSLTDGRTLKAEVLGGDPDADIAVLKIAADDLSEVKMADSDRLEVGDFVVAIGNPFALGQTVTTGVVSALGRTGLGIEGYEDFIQTDASINPGNSGGALVNLRGELIGINTAILAPTGGNVGIGFAIPVNMAKASIDQIVEHGEVKRGQLGVGIQDITPDLRQAFKLRNGQRGVLITSVAKDSEAEKGGLKTGDIIIAVDDKPTRSAGHLRSQIGQRKIGDKLRVTILREGDEEIVKVTLQEPPNSIAGDTRIHKLLEGASFEDNPDGSGVVVTGLAPNSNAAYSGLRPGDVIIGANNRRVNSVGDLQKVVDVGETKLLLLVQRGGGAFYLVIR